MPHRRGHNETDLEPARQALILLVSYVLLGGGASTALMYLNGISPGTMKKAVKRVVTDDARRDAILSDIDHWAKELKAQDKDVYKARTELQKIAKRHDATRSEADQITAKLDASFLEMDRKFLDTRFRIKEQTSRAEWDALSARLNK